MATGVNYWSSYEPTYKVRESVWGRAEPDSSSEEGGGGVTWDTPTMEVRGQLIHATEPGPNKKQQAQRLVELQDRRQGLQALLSTRLAELRRICLQEAELTGLLPSDFPLEQGEKAPSVRRRGGSHRLRKNRTAELEENRSKQKKTLFSSTLRKPTDPEHTTALQQNYRSKRVHRGCHTDESVRSESSSTSDSTGHDYEESVALCRLPMVTAGSSPVEVFSQNKTRNNSVHNRSDSQDVLHRPSPPHPPPPPPRSQDGSTSSGHTEPEQHGRSGGSRGGVNVTNRSTTNGPGGGANTSRRSNSSEDDHQWVNGLTSSKGGPVRTSETDSRTLRTSTGSESTRIEPGLKPDPRPDPRPDPVRVEPVRGRPPYSDLLLDYVWTKQQQMLQRQQSHGSRQPITALYQSTLAPPTHRGLTQDRNRIKVTRTKSCGPFLPVQPPGAENYDSQHAPLQPDPHPHLLPPRPLHSSPQEQGGSEEATRSLHKALALEGLRDWYLRNTLGSASSQNPTNGNAGPKTNGIKGRRRTTHGVIHHYQDSNSHNAPLHYQDSNSHNAPLHHSNFKDINHNGTIHKKSGLPHSATFHGLSLHGRSVDGPLYNDSYPLHKQTSCDQPSPGTLV